MRIAYCARSVLDYRIHILDTLDKLIDGNLTEIFYDAVITERIVKRTREILGERAVALEGAQALGFRDNITS